MLNEFFILMRSELVITAIIFILLFAKIGGKAGNSASTLQWVQILLLLNFLMGFLFSANGSLFGGMFQTNSFIALQKNILNGGVYLISLLFGGWFSKNEQPAEFFILLLSSLLGMFLMISSGHLLMFYLGLELATIPVAALANFDTGKKRSSEAAFKMIFSSAFSSAIMLFGISLIYGITGTLRFDELFGLIEVTPLFSMAFIFFLASFAFKLSVVPFHLWTADVYEGAPVPVSGFLSVISKAAASFIFMTMLYKVFLPLQETWYHLIVILAMASMLIGNLFAIRQENIKRFLAFSSVAQAGFILAGISGGPLNGSSSVTYFILIYAVSNLAAFAVADVVASASGKESLNDYRGFNKSNPFLSWVLAIALFSLAGIPPTAGFFGKFFLLSSAAGTGNYWFLTFAALNMVISLYYYLKLVRYMFAGEPGELRDKIKISPAVAFALVICSSAALLLGVLSWVFEYIRNAVL